MNIEKLNLGKSTTIVAAVKKVSIKKIEKIISEGILHIGWSTFQQLDELYSQLEKYQYVKHHFIGHLQRNKVSRLLSYPIELIHSVDSWELLEKINTVASGMKKTQKVLLQINSDEKKEFGFSLDEVRDVFKKQKELPYIRIEGLMTIPSEKSNSRTIYKGLRLQRDKMEKEFKVHLPTLSMGMSDDYQTAIEEGATMVRLGTILFKD